MNNYTKKAIQGFLWGLIIIPVVILIALAIGPL